MSNFGSEPTSSQSIPKDGIGSCRHLSVALSGCKITQVAKGERLRPSYASSKQVYQHILQSTPQCGPFRHFGLPVDTHLQKPLSSVQELHLLAPHLAPQVYDSVGHAQHTIPSSPIQRSGQFSRPAIVLDTNFLYGGSPHRPRLSSQGSHTNTSKQLNHSTWCNRSTRNTVRKSGHAGYNQYCK